jgi:hypothetical protein
MEIAGSRRSPHRLTPSVLVDREHARRACAAVRMAVAVVLARCSAPQRVRSIADLGAVGGTHNTGCRARFCGFAVGAGGLRACSGCCARHFGACG